MITLASILIFSIAAETRVMPQAESQAPTSTKWLSGYQVDVRGEVLGYESALPDVRSALLVRSQESERSIAWSTPPMPKDVAENGVALTWLFGMDANPEQHEFHLRLNGEELLSFQNPIRSSTAAWQVESGDVSLRFRPTHIDRHEDLFGFAVLELPARLVTAGEPMTLEVIGESDGSPIWYMTFRHSPQESVRATSKNALLWTDDMGVVGQTQQVLIEAVHLGEPTSARIETSWNSGWAADLRLGANRIEITHPVVTEPKNESIELIYADGRRKKLPLTITPVKPWTIHLVQHTHTDLGYTRPQTEILADHLRYIDFALDYCDQTDHFSDDAKFRWTCEAAWPVQEYLRYRPAAQIDRLRRRISEGRIELTAMFANMSELLDERACAASLAPIAEMRRHGLPVISAMQNDVNGIAWIYADLLPEMGVKYLTMGEHGHRALIPFDVPTAFWWESPSGSRLLAWRPDHYNTGNFWGIHSGNLGAVEPAVFRYLAEIESNGYEMDHISVQYGGVFLDNAPPGIKANVLIQAWNKKYKWPRMRSSLGSEMPRWVEENYAEDLQTFRAAWPDWWSDGIASAPREVAAVRKTQNQLASTEAMLSMAALQGTMVPQHLLDRVARTWEQLVIYGEHTYGAAESVSDPDSENTQVQWAEKSAFAWDAVKEAAIIQEAAFGLLQQDWPRSVHPTIVVTNTLSWPRTGMVKVFIDKALLTTGQSFEILDADGNVAPAQMWKPQHDGNWWAIHVEDVPAFGWKALTLHASEKMATQSPPQEPNPVLDMDWYRVVVDPERGGVVSLEDKFLTFQLADPEGELAIGQLIHEKLGNRWQLERFMMDDFSREKISNLKLYPGDDGPLWKSVYLRGSSEIAPEPNGIEIEIRAYQQAQELEFRYRLRKRRSTDPESLYAAFPFGPMLATYGTTPKVKIIYDSNGAYVDPSTQLLPRTSSDWQAAQRYVQLDNGSFMITLSSPEILLHQLGGIHTGKFRDRAEIEKPHVFSWLFNNYWVTNFLADQSGELFWSQTLTWGLATECVDPEYYYSSTCHNIAWNHHRPLLARVLPPNASGSKNRQSESQSLKFLGDQIGLVSACPIADGRIMIQVRDIHRTGATFRIEHPSGKRYPVLRVDATGHIRPGDEKLARFIVSLEPGGNAHYLLLPPRN
ncbi:MAG: hypothetical protein HQ519_02215 [Planctomycetes bacterium]|nr:hypothetical protein [Planctomycetota bacterium]